MMIRWAAAIIVGLSSIAAQRVSGQPPPGAPPDSFTYREIDGKALHLYVFRPPGPQGPRLSNVVLLLHGGGWSAGAPDWTYAAARQFAGWGLAAIPVQYRLSAGKTTPLDALDDVCFALGWVRARLTELRLTKRIAGYGVSAGGQLIAATSTIGCGNGEPGPDVLLLLSPALDLARDQWFSNLLDGRATAASQSPLDHVRRTTAPTSIIQGAADVLTPLSGARRYCVLLRQHGQTCEVHVYEGLGHLLTRNLQNQETDFDPDPKARADGLEQHRLFLRRLQFLP
jgi:acetyl esterase/lipase